MKLVKYISGPFDNISDEECLAVLLSEKEMEVGDDKKKVTVANLSIFVDGDNIITRRVNIPHANDAFKGKDSKGEEALHPYWEELKTVKKAVKEEVVTVKAEVVTV